MQGLNCTISMRSIIQPDSYYKAVSVLCKRFFLLLYPSTAEGLLQVHS